MALPRIGVHPAPGKGRWKAAAKVTCACGAEGVVRVISRFDGTITWCDDTSPILSRWLPKNDLAGDDEPVCPTCVFKNELRSADLVDLMRLQVLLDKELDG